MSSEAKVKSQFDVMRGLVAKDPDIEPDVRAMLGAGLNVCELLVTSIVRIAESAKEDCGRLVPHHGSGP